MLATAVADDLPTARTRAYEGVGAISFDGAQYRTDIAAAAAGLAGANDGSPSR